MRGLNLQADNISNGGSLEIRTQTTFVGRLRKEKEDLEKRLVDVNAVLKSLEQAPDVAKVLEALNKLGY